MDAVFLLDLYQWEGDYTVQYLIVAAAMIVTCIIHASSFGQMQGVDRKGCEFFMSGFRQMPDEWYEKRA